MHTLARALVFTAATSLSFAGFVQTARAGMIGTEQVAESAGVAIRSADQARLLIANTLSRADVVEGLQRKGVDPAQAWARVEALTDAEAQAMAQQIEAAPAGATDVLGTIVFIFLLLLITDILGFTKVFPFTRAIR